MKKGLGKGINALISSAPVINKFDTESDGKKTGVIEIDINKIEPNFNQPRKYFDHESLEELAESLKIHGIIQPLLVKDEGDFYSLIAGERRWRAARIAKLTTVPVIIKEYNEIETIEVALIENIQREDLNPIEEAECYQRLIDDFFFTQEDIAKKIGKNRSTISNFLSLLELDSRVKNFIKEGKISSAHGKVLLKIEDPEMQFNFCENFIENKFSVRQAEEYLNDVFEEKKIDKTKTKNTKPLIYKPLEKDLKEIFGTKVNIRNGKKKGKIEIEYYSDEELDRIINIMKSTNK